MSIQLGNDVTFELDGYHELEVTSDFRIMVEKNKQIELLLSETGNLKIKGQITLDEGSRCNMLFMNECDDLQMDLEIHQKRDSNIQAGFYELNENTSIINIRSHLDEEGASATLVKSSITNAKKRYDIECIHHAPHTHSEMKNFEISNEHANYKIRACGTIEKGAYQSQSHQMSRILTTSDHQRSEAIPVLLIDENDVAASHANSMGKMDDDYLYYLKSRGIKEEQARELLTLSYLLPISEILDREETKEMLTQKIRSRAGL